MYTLHLISNLISEFKKQFHNNKRIFISMDNISSLTILNFTCKLVFFFPPMIKFNQLQKYIYFSFLCYIHIIINYILLYSIFLHYLNTIFSLNDLAGNTDLEKKKKKDISLLL